MDRRRGLHALVALAGGAVSPIGARAGDAPVARAVSGAARATLVELYTSEGCSSCPPADRWLSRIARREPVRVVPLALHVTYWDAIGWKDPFAQPGFAERQRWLTALGRGRTVYTPGVFVDGREWRRWDDEGAVARRLDEGARLPAAARIELVAAATTEGPVLTAHAWRRDALAPHARPALFVALTESALASRVTAGENRGETLRHDHVVRRFVGPRAFDDDGRASLSVPLDASAGRGPTAAVAFVQDLQTGVSLQALSMALGPARTPG